MLNKLKILISGDSFAVDYRMVDPQAQGWTNALAEQYEITNIAQAGVSEYKIVKQLESVDVGAFDYVIVTHTSPYRVHIKEHPVHANSVLHKHCDLLYSDLEKSRQVSDPVVGAALDYFKYVFDVDYYNDIYLMMLDQINSITYRNTTLHLTFFDNQMDYPFDNFINASDIFKEYPGNTNHLSARGNLKVVEKIKNWLLLKTQL